MQDQRASLEWRDGAIPVSTRFDDPYFSLENGLAETRHVFLAGNDLPDRFEPGFHIGELGFGTGLNFLAAWCAWEETAPSGRLHFTSFEAYPMSLGETRRALRAFPEVNVYADRFLDVFAEAEDGPVDLGTAVLTVITGDARQTVPDWSDMADAWFLDGFSPAKNPELWDMSLLQAVADHTKPGGTAATYTAAGFVRRNLEAAGFQVTRSPGFGRKRHMTRACLA